MPTLGQPAVLEQEVDEVRRGEQREAGDEQRVV
jgi:hypothetical protein